MIRIGIVDDHKIFRDGVASILDDIEDLSVIWSTSNFKTTLQALEENGVDVILMDITLGDESGIVLSKVILEKDPDIKILAISMHHEDDYILKILEVGAKGYLLKDAGSEEMIKAIKTVAGGDTYYSNEVSKILIRNLTNNGLRKKSPPVQLTRREIEILKLIADEYSNPEIADKLFISIRTVDSHRRNLLDKLDVKNTAGLVKFAIQHGLIQ
ncbi:response regulator [Portibacter marinus]|uniref:response regulator n=1 Tax=Portibacter marinus TaxID=2898660 RepID=UPI001F37D380|nr:response regulator transcription factor [Portibacter marinus]